MSLEMLNGGLEERIPRLYRHHAESLMWVLAYATVINVEYKSHSVKISRPRPIDSWFTRDTVNHISSKHAFPVEYGRLFPVTKPHERYLTTIRSLIRYWVEFDEVLLDSKSTGLAKPEIDDPKGALESLVKGVGTALDADAQEEFVKQSESQRMCEAPSDTSPNFAYTYPLHNRPNTAHNS